MTTIYAIIILFVHVINGVVSRPTPLAGNIIVAYSWRQDGICMYDSWIAAI